MEVFNWKPKTLEMTVLDTAKSIESYLKKNDEIIDAINISNSINSKILLMEIPMIT